MPLTTRQLSLLDEQSRPSETVELATPAVQKTAAGGASGEWTAARENLQQAIRDLAERVVQLREENLQLRGDLRKTRLRESALREDKAALLRDLQSSLDTVDKVLDMLAVSE